MAEGGCLLRLLSSNFKHWRSLPPSRFICNRFLSKSQASEARKLRAMVVGLGNHSMPDTRHSVGMLVVDCLAKQLGALWQLNRSSLGHIAVAEINKQELVLLKPSVLMNINGRSIARACRIYDISPCNVLLVHDDLDKPVGKYSIKHGGSAGGHNGVRSAITSLRSDVMKRVRVGIGRPGDRYQVKSYVLDKFHDSEIPTVQDTAEMCCKVLMDELHLILAPPQGTQHPLPDMSQSVSLYSS